jgi:S1-C subfamily serine protease
MSSKTLKVVAIVSIVAIFFSAFSFYLILDSVSLRDQLHRQEEQLSELQDSLEQLDDLQGAIEQLAAQQEQLKELQNAIRQLDEQEEQLSELQKAIVQLDELQDALEQFDTQDQQFNNLQTQLNDLQTSLGETQTSIQETKTSLSNLSNQLNALEQSISTDIAELETTIENLQGFISNLSDLEGVVDQLLNTPEQVYNTTYKSVVVIRTAVGQGSGFFIESNLIATNYHVVKDETDIEIEFFDTTRTQATTIGSDAYSDITVLTVPTTPDGIIPLNFSDQASIGQQVVAIGNPLGLTDSLTSGYISQVNRLLDLDPIIIPVLQLDLTIAPGSSGGPLLDLSGDVVGIINAATEDADFCFAVPYNLLNRVVPILMTEGEYTHPFVGISVEALTPDVISSQNILNVDSNQKGLIITDVVPNSPADDAGLNPAVSESGGITANDIILAVDGHSTFTVEDWVAYMEGEVSPDQTITLTIWRSDVTSTVDVTTGERPPYAG